MGHQSELGMAELSADATWPAEESIPLGPWRLRATHGYSHRANSVRTVAAESMSANWDDLVTEAEAFYREHRLPSIFHISPATMPSDLDQILDHRGHLIEKSSEVLSADPVAICAATARQDFLGQIILHNDPDADWLSCALDERIGPKKIREQICRRIPAPRAFASIIENGRTIARALGAVNSGIGWVYCMATVPDRQRRGCATRLLNSLADWSSTNGAKKMYLQVQADNAVARELYVRSAFVKQYEYHYRVRRV